MLKISELYVALTIFPVGVTTNWFKKLINYCAHLPQILLESYEILVEV